MRAGYNEETAAIVRQIETTGLKRVAVVYNDDAYGKAGLPARNALKTASGSGVQIVAREGVVRNTAEIGDAMQGSMKAKPDAVVMISAYRTAGAFVKEALRRGYNGQFYNVSFVGTGPGAAGGRAGQRRDHLAGDAAPGQCHAAGGAQYLRLLKAAGKSNDYDYASIEGFIAAKAMVEGLRRAGREPSREAGQRAGDHAQRRPRRLHHQLHAGQPRGFQVRGDDHHQLARR